MKNYEARLTAMVIAGVIGWFTLMYLIVHNVMDAMTATIVPMVLMTLGVMFVADVIDDIKERKD
jgi:hypothetical protein